MKIWKQCWINFRKKHLKSKLIIKSVMTLKTSDNNLN